MSEWRDLAANIFRRSAQRNLIYGDGEWLLLSKCSKLGWVVTLFATSDELNDVWQNWKQNGCPYHRCKGHAFHGWQQLRNGNTQPPPPVRHTPEPSIQESAYQAAKRLHRQDREREYPTKK